MIRFKFSFLIVAAVLIVMGRGVTFAVLFVSVTMHELAHTLMAKRFGAQVAGVYFTPLGEAAVIRRMEYISAPRRAVVMLIGPAVNALIGLGAYGLYQYAVLYAASPPPDALRAVYLYNALLCVFNLLPVFPLDGGRLWQLWLGNLAGWPRANRIIIRVGRTVGLLLIGPGLLQAVLYPCNISLLCMGVYLWRLNKSIHLTLTHEFLQAMLTKPAQIAAKGSLPSRVLTVSGSLPLARVLDRLCLDYFTYITLNGSMHETFTETDVLHCVMQNGLGGTAGDVFARITS